MTAFDPESWHDLFVAMAGAAAALAGLLFVAVSINLADILKYPTLPRRALETLLIMLGVVLVSIFVLVPEQTPVALGLEIAAVGAVLGTATLVPRARMQPEKSAQYRIRRFAVPIVTLVICFAPMVVAGVSVALGAGAGLYWLVPSLVCGFAAAITNAWVLLVEILR